MTAGPLLCVRGLRKRFVQGAGLFGGRARPVEALAGFDIEIATGGITALVGASGAGKSTAALCVLRLLRPDAGSIRFAGRDIAQLPEAALRPLRPQLQPVFQDPTGSLTPHRSVQALLTEPLLVHGLASGSEAEDRAARALDDVGLPRTLLRVRPPALSGGQRQRVALARALVLAPRLLVCDEPTSALDLSIQAGILALLERLRAEQGLACLFVSHDLGVVRSLADRVAVLEAGRVVEEGPTQEVWGAPRHAATHALLAAARGS